jgi:hypothetical protein
MKQSGSELLCTDSTALCEAPGFTKGRIAFTSFLRAELLGVSGLSYFVCLFFLNFSKMLQIFALQSTQYQMGRTVLIFSEK